MAAAGPRGRDGPSPREFTTVRHFMMADLGLSGLPLLVYARIFGFCDAGCGYFESKGNLARFLNVQERSVHRAIRDLLDRGFIEECGQRETLGRPTLYRTTDAFLQHFGLETLNDLPRTEELREPIGT